MKVLMIGDIMERAGTTVVARLLPKLIADHARSMSWWATAKRRQWVRHHA